MAPRTGPGLFFLPLIQYFSSGDAARRKIAPATLGVPHEQVLSQRSAEMILEVAGPCLSFGSSAAQEPQLSSGPRNPQTGPSIILYCHMLIIRY